MVWARIHPRWIDHSEIARLECLSICQRTGDLKKTRHRRIGFGACSTLFRNGLIADESETAQEVSRGSN